MYIFDTPIVALIGSKADTKNLLNLLIKRYKFNTLIECYEKGSQYPDSWKIKMANKLIVTDGGYIPKSQVKVAENTVNIVATDEGGLLQIQNNINREYILAIFVNKERLHNPLVEYREVWLEKKVWTQDLVCDIIFERIIKKWKLDQYTLERY